MLKKNNHKHLYAQVRVAQRRKSFLFGRVPELRKTPSVREIEEITEYLLEHWDEVSAEDAKKVHQLIVIEIPETVQQYQHFPQIMKTRKQPYLNNQSPLEISSNNLQHIAEILVQIYHRTTQKPAKKFLDYNNRLKQDAEEHRNAPEAVNDN